MLKTHTITHKQHREGGKKEKGANMKREGWKKAGDMLAKENLYFVNVLQWFLFHHTGRPHSNPALHTKRAVCVCVCTDIFISPQDIVVMLVKSKPRPVKHILFSLIGNYVNPCKGLSTVCAIQSYQWGLLIRKCKVGHL